MVFTTKQLTVSTISLVNLKTKFKVGLLDQEVGGLISVGVAYDLAILLLHVTYLHHC